MPEWRPRNRSRNVSYCATGSLEEADAANGFRDCDLIIADLRLPGLPGTEAITRVLIESADASGMRWWTVGVSENIIEASWQALADSFQYKLEKEAKQISSPSENENADDLELGWTMPSSAGSANG